MSRRVLVIPAAGLGSRLGAAVPKLLVPVGGVPMIDRIATLYDHAVVEIVLIVHPSFADAVRQHVAGWTLPVSFAVQERPTGMLDAIALGADAVRAGGHDEVWITWCDQVAVHPTTVHHLAEATSARPRPALALPTVWRQTPYIHLQRSSTGRIEHVLHRREGDRMPELGESDMGLFGLSATTYLQLLPQYAKEAAIGQVTGERNFLPFIPWLAAQHDVVTFPSVDEVEAVGVNTPAELALVERYLAGREGTGA
jgi:bifunctional UDP-N-acetylglucosamine pyrophosphorylase / glucosamine-1-phosphate N-acetyltransferase